MLNYRGPNSYLCPPLHLTHTKGPWITHVEPLGPHQSQEKIQNTPKAAFCLSWFPIGKSIMLRPLLMLTTTPPHKSISPIPKDPESHIGCPWGSLGFHQSQKLTKTTQFYVAVFRMAKIMLWPPKCLDVSMSISIKPIQRDLKSCILGPTDPISNILGKMWPRIDILSFLGWAR